MWPEKNNGGKNFKSAGNSHMLLADFIATQISYTYIQGPTLTNI